MCYVRSPFYLHIRHLSTVTSILLVGISLCFLSTLTITTIYYFLLLSIICIIYAMVIVVNESFKCMMMLWLLCLQLFILFANI